LVPDRDPRRLVGQDPSPNSDGVLTVTLPKTPEAQKKEKKIEIKRG
jgi:hypothetical protein